MSSPLVMMNPLQPPSAEPQPSPPYPLRERWNATAAERCDERDRPQRHEADAGERKRRAEGSDILPPAIGLVFPVLTQTRALAWTAGRRQMTAAAAAAAAAAEPATHQAADTTTMTTAAAIDARAGALLSAAALASATARAASTGLSALPLAMAGATPWGGHATVSSASPSATMGASTDATSWASHGTVSSATPSTMIGASTAVASPSLPLDTPETGAAPFAVGTSLARGNGTPAGPGRSAAAEPIRRDLAGVAISAGLSPPLLPTTAPASPALPRQAPDARAFASAFEAQAAAAAAAAAAGSRTTLSVPMNRLGEGQHVLASWPQGIHGSHVQLRSSSALGHRVLSEALAATRGTDAGPWIVEASGRSDDDGPRRDRASSAPWEED